MMPAKVVLHDDWNPRKATTAAQRIEQPEAEPSFGPGALPSGDWFNTVANAAPYLTKESMQKALGMLDLAMGYSQQAKTLDTIIADASNGGGAQNWLYTALCMRSQVHAQQQQLLETFQRFCATNLAEQPSASTRTPIPMGRNIVNLADFKVGKPTAQDLMAACVAAGQAELLLKDLSGPAAAQHTNAATHSPATKQVGLQQHVKTPDVFGTFDARVAAATANAGKQDPVATRWKPGMNLPSTGKPAQGNKVAPSETSRSSARQVQTLSTSLQLLSNENPDCLFIVRRINKLGFKAGRTLKRHFSSFGAVVRVLVAHSTVRQHGDPQCHARRRPSSLGFVQMASKIAVEKILELGQEQEIEGSMIRIQKFQRQHAEAGALEENSPKLLLDDDSAWIRQMTSASDTSTLTMSTTASSAGSPMEEIFDDDNEESCDLHI